MSQPQTVETSIMLLQKRLLVHPTDDFSKSKKLSQRYNETREAA